MRPVVYRSFSWLAPRRISESTSTLPRRSRRGMGAIAGLFSAFALACGGDDGPSGNQGSIQVTATPSSLTVPQGGSGTVTVTLTRGGGFDAAVNVSVSGLPSGVGASVSPTQLTGDITTATVSVTVAAAVPVGTYTATVTASATGVGQATVNYTLDVTEAPNYSLSVSPNPVTITAGNSGSATVNITRTGGFAGAVTLSLSNPPSGISGTFNPNNTTENMSALTLTVTGAVAAGNYSLTIMGAAQGVPGLSEGAASLAAPGDRTVTLNLVVNAGSGSSISLSLNPTSLTIPQGGSSQSTLTITRTNFTGSVNVAPSGAPNGMTVTPNPGSTTGGSSTISVSVGSGVASGTYNVTITGSGTGVNAQATLTVNVTQSGGGGSQVEFQFCSLGANPVFLAYQDGAGPWTPVTATFEGGIFKYRFNLTQGRGGVYYVQEFATSFAATSFGAFSDFLRTPHEQQRALRALRRGRSAAAQTPVRSASGAASAYETTVFYYLLAEMQAAGLDNCSLSHDAGKTVFVPFSAISAGQFGLLSLGGAATAILGGLTPSPAMIENVVDAPTDFVGVRTDDLFTPTRVAKLNNVNPPNGSTLNPGADFAGPNSWNPEVATIGLANLLGDEHIDFSGYYTPRGYAGPLGFATDPSQSSSAVMYGFPEAEVQQGEVHEHITLAAPPGTTTAGDIRFHLVYQGAMENTTVSLLNRITGLTATPVAAQQRLYSASADIPSEADKFMGVFFETGTNSQFVGQSTAFSAANAAGGNSLVQVSLGMPNLTSLAGFPSASLLSAGSMDVTLYAVGWNNASTYLPVVPAAGTTVRGTQRTIQMSIP